MSLGNENRHAKHTEGERQSSSSMLPHSLTILEALVSICWVAMSIDMIFLFFFFFFFQWMAPGEVGASPGVQGLVEDCSPPATPPPTSQQSAD